MVPDLLVTEPFDSLNPFLQYFRYPVPPDTAALIVAADTGDLCALLEMKEFFRNIRVILAIPDDDPNALILARQFWPRYIASKDGDFSDVAAVLRKMAQGEKR